MSYHDLENLKYVIMNLSNVTQSKIDDCMQTNVNTLRRNNSNTQTILKWEGENPSWVNDLGLTIYSNKGVREYLTENPSEWEQN